MFRETENMAYKVQEIANKLIKLADIDEANGGDAMTNLRLQKLLYYEQGYHLALFGTPLFNEDIESWMYGPVVPTVYNEFSKYGKNVLPVPESVIELSDKEERLFNQVFDSLREFSAIGLMNLTHKEAPWKNAFPHDRGTIINKDSMKEFFKTQL